MKEKEKRKDGERKRREEYCRKRWRDEGMRDADWADKQPMIGCQAADKKHKVNVKLRDHNMSIPLSLSLSLKLSRSSHHPLF